MQHGGGGVVVNERGALLLLKKERISGYVWPLAGCKGEETPEEAALRAIADQGGYRAEIISRIPKILKVKDAQVVYFLMKAIHRTEWAGLLEEPTWVHWGAVKDFVTEKSPPPVADLTKVILESALDSNTEHVNAVFETLPGEMRALAGETHELLMKTTKDAFPLADGSLRIQYCCSRYPGLFFLQVDKTGAVLEISSDLGLGGNLERHGIDVRRSGDRDRVDLDRREVVHVLASQLGPALSSYAANTLCGTGSESQLRLPLLELDLETLCQFSQGLTSEPRAVGQTFTYRYDEVKRAAVASGENLDEFLTRHVAEGMLKKPPKRKYLFWYAPHSEQILITVCDRYRKAGFGWLRDIPGHYDSGQGYVRPNAMPFLYWDGGRLFRIYPVPDGDVSAEFEESFDLLDLEEFGEGEIDVETGEPASGEQLYVSDLGAASGIELLPVGREDYMEIAGNKEENFDYSVVPASPQSTLQVGGKEFVLHHAHFRLEP